MKLTKLVLLTILALGTWACDADSDEVPFSPGTGDKVLLRLHLKEGNSYSIRMTSEQQIDQELNGRSQHIDQTIGMSYTYTVTQVDPDGTISIDVLYDSVLFKQDGPMGLIEYDSTTSPDDVPMMASGFAALVGQQFSIKISATGEVLDVTGIDEMLNNMFDSDLIPAGPQKEAMKEALKKQFGTDAMKEMMQTGMTIYPAEPVGTGARWSRTNEITSGFPMTTTTVYTLEKRAGGVAYFETKGTIKPNSNSDLMDMGEVSMSIEFSGTQDGTMELDEATGLPKKMVFQQNCKGDMTIEAPNDETIHIPMDIKATTTLEAVLQPKSEPGPTPGATTEP